MTRSSLSLLCGIPLLGGALFTGPLGCGGSADDPFNPGGTDGLGETITGGEAEVVRAELVPTVFELSWDSSGEATSRVRFWLDGEEELSTAWTATASVEHRAWVLGLPEDSVGTYQIELKNAEGTVFEGDSGELETGSLDDDLPRPQWIAGEVGRIPAGFTMVPIRADSSGRQWLTIMDGQARMVWGVEVQEASHRMRAAFDGSGIVYIDLSPGDNGNALRQVSWDGATDEELVAGAGPQDFDVVDEDTFIALVKEERVLDFSDGPAEVIDDVIVEIDLDGSSRRAFMLLDHMSPDTSAPAPKGAGSENTIDWAHVNYLDYDPEHDSFQVSMRTADAAMVIDRSSGTPLWTVGNDIGDYDVVGDERLLAGPHSAQALDGGVLLFNHGDGGKVCAGAVFVELDDAASTAEATWRSEADGCLEMNYLGNAQRLANGDTLVGYAHLGFIEDVDADGDLIGRAELPFGPYFLYAERLDALGWPQ